MVQHDEIPLAHNENYWMHSEDFARKISDTIGAYEFSRYPVSYDPLKRLLAEYANADKERIIVTAGSDAAISIIVDYCRSKGLVIGLPVPTFYGYERIISQRAASVIPAYYREADGAFIFPLEEVLHQISSSQIGCIFLCTPNNPLGCSIPSHELAQILDAAREHNILAVVDEAYLEFGGESSVSRINSQPIVIIRTLSKAFGLAGARVGYCISSPGLTSFFESQLLPWPVAYPSVRIAEAMLAKRDLISGRRQLIIEQRNLISAALAAIPGITTYVSSTNFILMRVPDANALVSSLRADHISIAETAWMSSFDTARALLASKVRMAIPSPEDADFVLSCMRKSLQT